MLGGRVGLLDALVVGLGEVRRYIDSAFKFSFACLVLPPSSLLPG